jgi:hypothetical protein
MGKYLVAHSQFFSLNLNEWAKWENIWLERFILGLCLALIYFLVFLKAGSYWDYTSLRSGGSLKNQTTY